MNRFFNWFNRSPLNGFYYYIGLLILVAIVPVVTWTAPNPLTWIVILMNGGLSMWYLYNWVKMKRGPKS